MRFRLLAAAMGGVLIACGAAVAFAPAAAAQEPPEFELPDVLAPGRRPQRAASSPASITVLTASELRRLGVRTVGEAMAFVPETLARAYGGPGSLITPGIRGSSAEQVLILLDGVPLNSIVFGNVDLSTIPVDDVERIEVLRGPFSAIYGSGALGGVVSIVTRRRGPTGVAATGGSLGVYSLALTSGVASRLTLRYEGAQGARPNSDYRLGYASLRLGGGESGWRWDASLIGTTGDRGAPGPILFPSPTARQQDRRLAGALTLERTGGRISDRARISLHADGVAFQAPAFAIDDRHDALALSGEWQRAVRISETRVFTFGADGQHHRLSSTRVGERSATVGAFYFEDDRSLGSRLLLSAGLRADYHSAYGVQINPRAGLVYFARPDVRVRLAAGRTFRGPTLADLYWIFDGFVVGNPLLRPEYAWSVEGGVEVRLPRGPLVRATAFWSDVRDLIIYVPDAAFVFSPQNVGAAAIRGASLELEGALSARWLLRASATWLDATDASTGRLLPNRPRWSGSAALGAVLPHGATLTMHVVAVGDRFADAMNTVTLAGYVTTGLVLQAPLGRDFALRASVQNLFDARYEPVQGFPVPGRTVLAELVLRR